MARVMLQEDTYRHLVGKINASESRLNSVRSQNRILEEQHERDRADLDGKSRTYGYTREKCI
jgi:hypothetical protein